MDNKKEYILCAAIWYNDGKERVHQPFNIFAGIVVCGQRHSNCYPILAELFPDKNYKQYTKQGFLTSTNLFVNRQVAGDIARGAGQLSDNTTIDITSEDLY